MKYSIVVFIIFLIAKLGYSQDDITAVYKFLTIPSSAYEASLGGSPIASPDSNINMLTVNPALLNPGLDQQIGINYNNVQPGVSLGLVSWGYDMKALGFLAVGIQYLNYGNMDRYDEFGNSQGTFSGGDYAFIVGWSQPLMKNLTLGANVKGIYSKIDIYKAYAAAFDAGLTYNNPKLKLTVSAVAKNIGNQIDPYVEGVEESLPMDYQFGISKGLAHAPFRFSVVAHNLHKTEMLITNENTVIPNNTDLAPEELETDYIREDAEKIARHLIFGFEFRPSEKFSARVGYNYYQRSTMKMVEKGGLTGFSLGATLRIKGFYIEYARAAYHLAGATNHISVRTNLRRFFSN
jgi:hypothetical protein